MRLKRWQRSLLEVIKGNHSQTLSAATQQKRSCLSLKVHHCSIGYWKVIQISYHSSKICLTSVTRSLRDLNRQLDKDCPWIEKTVASPSNTWNDSTTIQPPESTQPCSNNNVKMSKRDVLGLLKIIFRCRVLFHFYLMRWPFSQTSKHFALVRCNLATVMGSPFQKCQS